MNARSEKRDAYAERVPKTQPTKAALKGFASTALSARMPGSKFMMCGCAQGMKGS